MTLSTNVFFRRGMEAAHSMHGMMHSAETEPDQPGDGSPKVPALAALIFALTVLVCVFLLFSVAYTLTVVLTLSMVEAEESDAYVPVGTIEPLSTDPPAYSATPAPKPSNGEPEDADLDTEADADVEVLLVRNKPVTASIRQTILHLRARAGYWSRFRGLSMFIAWNVASGFIVAILSAFIRNPLGVAVAAIVAETAVATMHMAWVHIVISEPSEKRWYQRIPSFKNWPKVAPAVALWATSNQIVAILPLMVCGSFGSLKHMHDPTYEPGKKDLYAVGGQAMLGMGLTLLLFVLLQIPATVTMVRVSASMLPEDDETIVTFDRSFGGKTTPAIIGGQQKVGLVEAWRSFPWPSRMRLLKLVVKVSIIMMTCWLLFTIVLVAEAHILLGDKLGEFMKSVHGIARPH